MADVVSWGFRGVARLRHARVFHPRGLLLTGDLTVPDGADLPLEPGTRPVVARMSKGAGLPGSLPDILGLALRVPDGDTSWDLALATCGTGRASRMAILPARRWDSARFGSVLPYRRDAKAVWLLAIPDEDDDPIPASLDALAQRVARKPLSFTLHTGGTEGTWCPAARLVLDTRLPGGDTGQPAFDPMARCASPWTMSPRWVTRVREHAYAGSREGRGASRGTRHGDPPTGG